MVWLTRIFEGLLSQTVENLEHLLFITGLEQDDVIVFTLGLEKTANRLGNNPFLIGPVLEHRFRFP